MASRTAPRHVADALRKYDPNTEVVWDDRVIGWRFVYKGRACDAILMHDDGVAIMELDSDEIVRIARQSDMHHEFGNMLKSMTQMRGRREYARRLAEAKRAEELRLAVEDRSNPWRKRLDHAI